MKFRPTHVQGLLTSLILTHAGLGAACDGPRVAPADLVLRNGKVVTMDDARPEAQAVAISGDTIGAVGSEEEIHPYIGSNTEVIDLEGQLTIPGFIESHGHFTAIGRARIDLNLRNVRTWDEIVAMVAEATKSAKPGEWLIGRGWHQEKWESVPTPNVEGFPVHDSLSKVSPTNPVVLTHASGHATFVNARAMAMSGITARTPNPPGGEILKDPRGHPTGLLRETASALVGDVLARARAGRTPQEFEADTRHEVELAIPEVLSKGITSFQDAGSTFETVELLKEYADNDRLGARLWVMLRAPGETLRQQIGRYKLIDYGNAHLTVRAIKHTIDGALGTRGAWLLAPYSDLPTTTGLATTPVPVIEETAKLALAHGFQLCVHAIGDRGNRETLNLYERMFRANPDKRDLRWRIEHAQHLHPDDIPRFARLGVIASIQGIHSTSDGPWVVPRLGEQRAREGAYAWQSLLKSGAVVINGTDAPVEDVNPIRNFYASVTRKMNDGRTFFPEERMTRQQALKSYTLSAAYGAFEEDRKGSITPGKLADVTVLSTDLMTAPEDEILKAEVVYTIVGGKIRYRKDTAAGRR